MDFERGVTEHLAWKKLLFEYIARPDGRLKPSEVVRSELHAGKMDPLRSGGLGGRS